MKISNKDLDLGLVKRAKAGDYQAFDLLVLKYQSRLISTAFKFVKDQQIAEDLVQDSFIKSFKSIGSFREDSTFYTWIYRITVNTSKNYLVSKKRKDELEKMKNLVTNAISSKPKNLIKPIGISEIDMLKKHISNFWTPPIGAAGAENLIVDIFMEFNKEGYVLKAEWVNRGMNSNNSFYKAAANAAIRAVKDAEPMPLPVSKFKEWRTLTFRFDPATMFGGY